MCLAVPALIKTIDGAMAEAELGNVMTRVSILLTPDVREGDYVIMHAGYAIQILDAEEAEAIFELLEKVTGTDATE
jgi:hydrogenase expression/formation protein HypC